MYFLRGSLLLALCFTTSIATPQRQEDQNTIAQTHQSIKDVKLGSPAGIAALAAAAGVSGVVAVIVTNHVKRFEINRLKGKLATEPLEALRQSSVRRCYLEGADKLHRQQMEGFEPIERELKFLYEQCLRAHKIDVDAPDWRWGSLLARYLDDIRATKWMSEVANRRHRQLPGDGNDDGPPNGHPTPFSAFSLKDIGAGTWSSLRQTFERLGKHDQYSPGRKPPARGLLRMGVGH